MKYLVDYMTLPKHERQTHIDLSMDCVIRGTTSTHCRGILAHFLDTDMNTMKVDCCHACNNEACSNPHHLYWGTRGENIMDLRIHNPDVVKNMGSRGVTNKQYGVVPWRNNAIKAHPTMVHVWTRCIFLYHEYFTSGWDYSKYGQGESYFMKKYNFSPASVKKIWIMFKDGWNPVDDLDYNNWVASL